MSERVPVLGLCYGHQLLADAMGGEVGYLPRGLEIGTVDIDLLPDAAGDALFRGVPARFPAHTAHAQTVVALPPGAVRLAASVLDLHHAFRLGACAWGVQFHPEYDTRVMAAYIRAEADDCRRAGWDMAELLRTIRDTPAATALLRRFAQIAEAI